ncbi:unnamed protein product [Absidia cylindrospora]
MASFDQLPFEILLIILLHVNGHELYGISSINRTMNMAVQPTLRRWRTHCRVIQRWKLFLFQKELRLSYQQKQQPLGQHLRSLEFHDHLSDSNLVDVMQYVGAQLEVLILRNGRYLSDTSLKQMPRHYPHLKLLHLEHASVTGWFTTELGLHCRSLTHLTLLDCSRLKAVYLLYALSRCSLTYVLFNRCHAGDMLHKHGTHLELQGVDIWELDALTGTMDRAPLWPDVTSLSSRGCYGWEHRLDRFLRAHPHLTKLTLQHGMLKDKMLDAISNALSGVLTVVNIAGNPWLTAASIRRLVLRCPSLIRLSFHDCAMTMHDFPDLVAADQRPWVVRSNNVLPNFKGLGRHKINIIRQHSTYNGNYQQ